jgi:hypothetical protein
MTREDKQVFCRCGHKRAAHFGKGHGEDCGAPIEGTGFCFCSCKRFVEFQFKSEEEIEMAKKNSGKKEKKSEGRTPRLEGLVENPFKIYARSGGKDFEAQVLKSGMIVYDDKEYTSPSSAGIAVLVKTVDRKNPQIDGWKFWKYNKDGERVELNVLRGSKSPLKAESPKAAKPKKEKKARKPRAKKQTETASETTSEAAA